MVLLYKQSNMQMNMEDNVNVVTADENPVNDQVCSDVGWNSTSLVSSLSGPTHRNESQFCLDDPETFYDKLYKLYKYFGLHLLINVRETFLNLHVFYNEVTKRGGYSQVTKAKRWEEISIAMKLGGIEEGLVELPQQLQGIYELFLYRFEQIYFYITPERADQMPPTMQNDAVEPKPKKLKGVSHSAITGGPKKQKQPRSTPSNPKDPKFGRPKRMRTAYQIFLKKECERLRQSRSLGEKPIGQSFRVVADSAWRNLSETERLPYIEESNKDKEMYSQQRNALEVLGNGESSHPENGPLLVSEYHIARPELVKLHDQQVPPITPAEAVTQNVLSNN